MLWWTLQQIKSKSVETRTQAVRKLGEAGPDEAVKALAAVLQQDPDVQVRLTAVQVLRDLKCEAAVETLGNALSDTEPGVRQAVADGIKQLGFAQGSRWLLAALKDEDAGVRWRVIHALEALGWHPVNDRERAWQRVAKNEYAEAAHLGAAAIEPLMAAMNTGPFNKRVHAVEALSSVADERAVKPLSTALKSDRKMTHFPFDPKRLLWNISCNHDW